MVVTLGVFAAIIGLMPGDLIANQPDYVSPLVQSYETVTYFSANNITVYKNTWDFDIDFNTMEFNQSGLADGHRLEFSWKAEGSFPLYHDIIYVKHAYPSPLGDWWLWSNFMPITDRYRSLAGPAGLPPGLSGFETSALTKVNLIALQTSDNSSYFECSDGEVTANFVVMNGNTSAWGNLSQSWDGQKLHVLSSFEVDFDAMKPNAWWLIAQLVFFQAPDFGIPGMFGDLLTYIFALGFWATVAIILYTIATRLIPTLTGGVEG